MTIDLDNLTIAAPCHANWSDMSGDERTRFCQLCKKHVYNISDMSRTDAVALIKEKEGNLCIRMFKRADGTVIVDNCPVGLRAVRNRMRWIGAGIAAALTFIGGVAAANSSGSAGPRRLSLAQWFFPPKAPPPSDGLMGNCPPLYFSTARSTPPTQTKTAPAPAQSVQSSGGSSNGK